MLVTFLVITTLLGISAEDQSDSRHLVICGYNRFALVTPGAKVVYADEVFSLPLLKQNIGNELISHSSCWALSQIFTKGDARILRDKKGKITTIQVTKEIKGVTQTMDVLAFLLKNGMGKLSLNNTSADMMTVYNDYQKYAVEKEIGVWSKEPILKPNERLASPYISSTRIINRQKEEAPEELTHQPDTKAGEGNDKITIVFISLVSIPLVLVIIIIVVVCGVIYFRRKKTTFDQIDDTKNSTDL